MCTTKHTCNGDNPSGLPFGKKAAPGDCPRCDELRSGAPARKWQPSARQQSQAQLLTDIRNHDCKRSNCGPVCTFGQW